MRFILRRIDNLLDGIPMYSLVQWILRILLAIAVVLAFLNVLSISPVGLLLSIFVLLGVCYVTNYGLGRLYHVPTNNESYAITALILACILPPSTDPTRLGFIALAGVLAMASKFILTWRHKIIFNPAAVAAVSVSLLGLLSVTWWIGNPYMLPFVAIAGFLVIRKIRRYGLFFAFTVASLAMTMVVAWATGQEVGLAVRNAILSGPLIFFATIMLTEPSTMPGRRRYQVLYGLLVGLLYASQLRLGPLSTSPHLVLIIGNIFAFIVSPHYRLRLRLKEKVQISEAVFDYVFTPERKMTFLPGQYMEWTLGHPKIDGRGNRRSFTIASSPTETDVHVGVKFYEPSSSFKRALRTMNPGDTIVAGQVAGDFVLPEDSSEKLVLLAGGIGITPFRSMAKYLVDSSQTRDATLFYFVGTPDELAYRDVFAEAAQQGIRIVPMLNGPAEASDWHGYVGGLTKDILEREAPGFIDRKYMISGPQGFVRTYVDFLLDQGVPRRKIVTDYFSGY